MISLDDQAVHDIRETEADTENQFWYFAAVVAHEGFSSAERTTGISEASLSKAVSRLEASLQVRLIERSTRRFRIRITKLGQQVYQHCQAMLESVDAAEALAARALAEPHGIVQVSCLQGLLEGMIANMLPKFLLQFPKVPLELCATSRPIDLIEEGVDLALSVREFMEMDGSLIARALAPINAILVVSPGFLQQHPVSHLEGVEKQLPTLSMQEDTGNRSWRFIGPGGRERSVRHRPRRECGDLEVLREAAVQGVFCPTGPLRPDPCRLFSPPARSFVLPFGP